MGCLRSRSVRRFRQNRFTWRQRRQTTGCWSGDRAPDARNERRIRRCRPARSNRREEMKICAAGRMHRMQRTNLSNPWTVERRRALTCARRQCSHSRRSGRSAGCRRLADNAVVLMERTGAKGRSLASVAACQEPRDPWRAPHGMRSARSFHAELRRKTAKRTSTARRTRR